MAAIKATGRFNVGNEQKGSRGEGEGMGWGWRGGEGEARKKKLSLMPFD